mmetsp:Transcript_1412/g.4558  ORF Transcript_1412/g.4558 Transcript_1412/m.4558 type:complete len:204 (+) Transcript_1412:910-1521(+)
MPNLTKFSVEGLISVSVSFINTWLLPNSAAARLTRAMDPTVLNVHFMAVSLSSAPSPLPWSPLVSTTSAVAAEEASRASASMSKLLSKATASLVATSRVLTRSLKPSLVSSRDASSSLLSDSTRSVSLPCPFPFPSPFPLLLLLLLSSSEKTLSSISEDEAHATLPFPLLSSSLGLDCCCCLLLDAPEQRNDESFVVTRRVVI